MTKTMENLESQNRVKATGIMEELTRLASFNRWPDGNTPSPITFARSGFTYSGEGHKVICPLCRLEVKDMRRGDNPAEEHLMRSPQCRLASAVNGIPRLELLSDTSRELDPMWNIYIKALSRSRKPDAGISASVTSSQPVFRADRQNPDFELLRREKIRLETFYDWPRTAHVLPAALASAGFFYTGTLDRVCCAFCRSSLRSWVPEDDPFEEHKKHYPNCPFVRNLDVANVRIGDEYEIGQSSISEPEQKNTSPASLSVGQASSPISIETYMKTPTVRAVLEMGFSEESVKAVVEEELSNNGAFFANAESLIEKLISLGIVQSSTREETPQMAGANSSAMEQEAINGNESSAETNVPLQSEVEDKKEGHGSSGKRSRGVRKKKKKKNALNEGRSSSPSGTHDQTLSSSLDRSPAAAAVAATNSVEEGEEAAVNYYLEEQELLEENSRLKEARTCKVCMDKEVDTVFLPCGHLVCCHDCSPQVRNCPICRTFIRGTVKTFLS